MRAPRCELHTRRLKADKVEQNVLPGRRYINRLTKRWLVVIARLGLAARCAPCNRSSQKALEPGDEFGRGRGRPVLCARRTSAKRTSSALLGASSAAKSPTRCRTGLTLTSASSRPAKCARTRREGRTCIGLSQPAAPRYFECFMHGVPSFASTRRLRLLQFRAVPHSRRATPSTLRTWA